MKQIPWPIYYKWSHIQLNKLAQQKFQLNKLAQRTWSNMYFCWCSLTTPCFLSWCSYKEVKIRRLARWHEKRLLAVMLRWSSDIISYCFCRSKCKPGFDIFSYCFVGRIRKDIFLSYMFIFEYGLLKLHLLREKISILIEERLHMRGDRFFFQCFHTWCGGDGLHLLTLHCTVLSVVRAYNQNHVQ